MISQPLAGKGVNESSFRAPNKAETKGEEGKEHYIGTDEDAALLLGDLQNLALTIRKLAKAE